MRDGNGVEEINKAINMPTHTDTHNLLYQVSMVTYLQTFSLQLIWTKTRNGMMCRKKKLQGGEIIMYKW